MVKKKTYLDSYIGAKPPKGAKEISFDKLSKEEQEEHSLRSDDVFEKLSEMPEMAGMFNFKFYQMPNGRNAVGLMLNFEMLKGRQESVSSKEGSVSFMSIDKAPTFPGCESGDKDCFSKMVYKHFSREFDADLPNQLGLDAGKKRVFIAFKIDKEGSVVDVKARAPHPKIKSEVLKVMNALPKMIPGEDEGKKVDVKYSIPLTLLVE